MRSPFGSKKERKATRAPRSAAASPSTEFLEGYEKRQRVADESRVKVIKEMHDQKINLFERFLKCMENKDDKKNEKETE
jgi:hypothetical protein